MGSRRPGFIGRLMLILICIISLSGCRLPRETVETAASTASETAPFETIEPPTIPAPTAVMPEPTAAPAAARADDLTLIYTREDGLWRWRQGEVARITANAHFPAISPDGSQVVFLRPADGFHQEIWAVGVEGENERRLVSIEDLDRIGGGVRDPNAMAVNPILNYAWLPGTLRLLFTTAQVFNGPGEDPLDDLYVADAAGGGITDLFLSGWGGRFAVSPDGIRLAVIQPEAIILTEPTGNNYSKVMTYGPVLTYSESPYYAQPRWSPEGDFMRVAVPPRDALAAPEQPTALWRIPIDGTPAVQEGSVTAVFFGDAPVEYSPDLVHVAYLKETGGEGSRVRELHLAAYDGSADQVYASGEQLYFIGWANDGRRFIFAHGHEGELLLGSLDGAPRSLGAATAGAFRVRWVDDQRILYAVRTGEVFELRLLDLESGGDLIFDRFGGKPPFFDLYP